MTDESNESAVERKISRKDFLKIAAGTGLGVMAMAIGGSSFFHSTTDTKSQPFTPNSANAQGKYGAVGSPANLTIGYLPYASDILTANLIKQAGLWEPYLPAGSKVNWLNFLGGTLVTNNMLADKVQIGYMGDAPSYRCLDILDSKVICMGSYEEGLTGEAAMKKFGEPKSLLQSIVVRPAAAEKYKAVENLNGAKIGVPLGSIGHKQAITLEQDGWELTDVPNQIAQAPAGDRILYPISGDRTAEKSVGQLIKFSGKKPGVKYGQVLDINTEIQMAQLRAGTIDLVCTWEPYVLWMEQRGMGKRLFTSTDTLCQCRTGTHFHVSSPIVARNDFIKARPDIIEGYLQAEEDAKEMISKDPDRSAELIHKEIPEVPLDILKKDVRMMIYDGRIHPEMLDHHRRSAKLWQDLKIFRGERTGWTPEQIVDYGYDPSFMDNVIQKRSQEGKWTSADLGILRNW